jgi:hypothetical protein
LGGTAGSSGNAGTTGNAGSTGNAGTGGGSACAAPVGTVITNFESTGTVGTAYFFEDTGLTRLTADTAGGSLVLTVNSGVPTTMYPYLGVGYPFNACVNASAYTGVKFKASGTLTAGCTIQFSVVDKQHSTVVNNGTCTESNCYASAKVFPLPATPTDVTVLFSEQSGGGAAVGAAPVDPTGLLNIQWQISPAGGAAPAACSGTVTIDDVTFI